MASLTSNYLTKLVMILEMPNQGTVCRLKFENGTSAEIGVGLLKTVKLHIYLISDMTIFNTHDGKDINSFLNVEYAWTEMARVIYPRKILVYFSIPSKVKLKFFKICVIYE